MADLLGTQVNSCYDCIEQWCDFDDECPYAADHEDLQENSETK